MPLNPLHSLQFLDIQTEDLKQIFEIETRAYPYPWRFETLQESMPSECKKHNFAKKIHHNQHIVAYGFLSIAAGEANLLNLTVDPRFQRKGLGRILLEHFIDIAEQANAESMFLEVRCSNVAAQKLYDGLGFNQIGVRKNYYPNGKTREDAWVMAKNIAFLPF